MFVGQFMYYHWDKIPFWQVEGTEDVHPAPLKQVIPLEILEKIDIRGGTIGGPGCGEVEKLIRMRVHFGDCTRTIFSDMK